MRVVAGALVTAALALVSACGSNSDVSRRSSDGDNEIAFVRGGRDGGIYVLAPATGKTRRVATGAYSPTWSPDGSQIAYVIGHRPKDGSEPRSAIWVANADGTEAKRITRDRQAANPSWSPDGRSLAYAGDLGIAVVSSDGNGDRTISFEPAIPDDLDWSPDGREIIASSLEGIVALAADGSGQREVTNKFGDGEPAWSPDGAHVAFTRHAGRGADRFALNSIYVVRSDGTGLRRLTHGAGDFEPAWCAGGKRIVFTRFPPDWPDRDDSDRLSELYEIDLDGRGLRQLTDNDVADGSPACKRSGSGQPQQTTSTAAADMVVVPKVRNLLFPAAVERLKKAGLEARRPSEASDRYARLRVFEQSPKPGERVARGTTVQLLVLDVSDPFGGREFDRHVWLTHPECDPDNPRARMYADLAKNHLRPGMTREAVQVLLGEPDTAEGDWPLGFASGFGVDCDFLHVEFDRTGRLVRVYHWQS